MSIQTFRQFDFWYLSFVRLNTGIIAALSQGPYPVDCPWHADTKTLKPMALLQPRRNAAVNKAERLSGNGEFS